MSNKHAVKEAPASYQSTPVPSVNRELQSFITGNPLTENINLWISATKAKSTSGRGSNKKTELVGIKKLRELILELAVRGKLVPQNPEDEPASELLKKIDAEKAKLLAEGKIKKQKKLPEISEDEKPFELPQGWDCIRLGNLVSKLGSGSTPRGGKTAYVEAGIPFLRSQNIWNEGLALDDIAFISKSTHENMSNTIVYPGDILLNITGASLGRSLMFPETYTEANVSQHVSIIRLINSNMTPFISLCIKSPLVQKLAWGRQVGMAIEGLSKKVLECFEMPIPPLAEQHRIAAKVDELMALCDQLEQHSEHQLDAHKQLVETLLATLVESENADDLATNWQRLAEHFDTLFSGALTSTAGIGNGGGEWSIDRLKDTILQLAVMGKLVPQNPEDEPASELLKRIDAEKAKLIAEGKIKKQKKLPEISEDEKPFELPDGWEWVFLQNACSKITDGDHQTPKRIEKGKMLLSAKNVRDGYLDLEFTDCISDFDYEKSRDRCLPEQGDLMIVSVGGTIGRSSLVPEFSSFALVRSVALIKPIQLLSSYLKATMDSELLQSTIEERKRGGAQPCLYLSEINQFLIPVPPFTEQHRIVAKVDELFALCDQLKTRLEAASETQLTLTEALVEQALQ